MTVSLKFTPKQCADALVAGSVIAYPTEAVWGLGCDPFNLDAVSQVLRLKQRPASKGLILVSGQIEYFSELLSGLDATTLKKIKASWPGHTTWLVPHRNLVPEGVHGDSDKVAIRVSAHPVVRELTDTFGGAIVSTSANLAGEPAAINLKQAQRYFADAGVIFALGNTGTNSRASKIIDALTGKVLRN